MGLTPEHSSYILELYDITNGDIISSQDLFEKKYFKISRVPIKTRWKEAGLEAIARSSSRKGIIHKKKRVLNPYRNPLKKYLLSRGKTIKDYA